MLRARLRKASWMFNPGPAVSSRHVAGWRGRSRGRGQPESGVVQGDGQGVGESSAHPTGLTGGARDGLAARAALGAVTGQGRFDVGLGGQCGGRHGRVLQRLADPWPRFGVMAWAASPSRVIRPAVKVGKAVVNSRMSWCRTASGRVASSDAGIGSCESPKRRRIAVRTSVCRTPGGELSTACHSGGSAARSTRCSAARGMPTIGVPSSRAARHTRPCRAAARRARLYGTIPRGALDVGVAVRRPRGIASRSGAQMGART
jgi:hypothetical protein